MQKKFGSGIPHREHDRQPGAATTGPKLLPDLRYQYAEGLSVVSADRERASDGQLQAKGLLALDRGLYHPYFRDLEAVSPGGKPRRG